MEAHDFVSLAAPGVPERRSPTLARRSPTLVHVVLGRLFVDDEFVVRDALAAGYPAALADWVPRGRVLRTAQDHDGRT